MMLPEKTITFSAILYVISLSAFSADGPEGQSLRDEAAHLSSIAKELEVVRSVARCDEASHTTMQPPGNRLWFDYQALCKALSNIEYGVRAHLVLRNSQPSMMLQVGVVDKEAEGDE